MRFWELNDGRAVAVGVAVGTVLMVLGLLVVGADPTDTEFRLATLPALVVGAAVALLLAHRRFRKENK